MENIAPAPLRTQLQPPKHMSKRPPTLESSPTFSFAAVLTEFRELLQRDPLSRTRPVGPVRIVHKEIFLPT